MKLLTVLRHRYAPLAVLACLAGSATAQPLEAIPTPYPSTSGPAAEPPLNANYASLLDGAPTPIAAPAVIPPAAEVESVIEVATPEPPPAESEVTPVELVEAVESAAAGVGPEAVPAPEPEAADAVELVGEEPTEATWWRPYAWLRPQRWDSGFEFGLNGASGTSESLSFRTGGYVKRATDDYKFDTSLYYNKTSAEGDDVQSNALLDLRYDFLLGDSPWTIFVLSQTFYDEFQAFDLNFNVNTGVGYQWIDDEWVQLSTSFGSGASREFGDAVADEWVPEASLGLNFEQKLGDSHRFYAKADYFPQWEDLSVYRVVADMGIEIDLPRPSGMALKLSATDRFDSNPSGAEPHNFNYAASLLWKL